MTSYPTEYDSSATLYDPRDDAIASLAQDWTPSNDSLVLDDASNFSADGGFVTVYVRYDGLPIEQRVTTFSYTGKSANSLTGATPLQNKETPRPAGSRVMQNIMADHRMAITQAVLAAEKETGNRGTEDEETLEWFTNWLTYTVKRPRPWYLVRNGTTGFIHDRFEFIDQTYRLQSWQNVTWLWEFGDGESSNDRDPIHVYEKPGKYTVRLTVTNDYGSRSLVVRDAIIVMGKAPPSCTISCSDPQAIAGETMVYLVADVQPPPGEPMNAPDSISWSIEPGVSYPQTTSIYILFRQGGVYPTRAVARTKLGNYAAASGGVCNVVERLSLWTLSQGQWSPEAVIGEYMPISSTWKDRLSGTSSISLLRDWDTVGGDAWCRESIAYTGGMHENLASFSAICMVASDKQTLRSMHVDMQTGSVVSKPDRSRGWGWSSARINSGILDSVRNQQVYVFGGHADYDDASGPSLKTVEHYGMITGEWETISLENITAGGPDEAVVSDMTLATTGSKKGSRIRTVAWDDSIYLLGSSTDDMFTRFASFNPYTRVWTSLPEPMTGTSSLTIYECALASVGDGIHTFSPSDKIQKYTPSTKIWGTLAGSTSLADTSTLLKAAAPSEAPGIDNTAAYITSHDSERGIMYKFDQTTGSAISIPARPSGLLSAMGVF